MAELLTPCPFCEGPPVPFVQNGTPQRGEAPLQDDYGDDGIQVTAFVFCHECGAEGPSVDALIYTRAEYFELEAKGVRLWQDRDARHRVLYDGGQVEGLNFFPRPDDPNVR